MSTDPYLPREFLRAMEAYADGKIGWVVAYAVTEAAAAPYANVRTAHCHEQALRCWRVLMDAHTSNLTLPTGTPRSEARIRRGRLPDVVNSILLGRDPAIAEAEESC